MSRQRTWKALIAAVAFTAAALATPAPAAAHCDSMDGPVVQAARKALAAADVTPVLMWVRPDDEPEIRRAFQRAMRVRSQGDEARELADLWFFETLVRIHREGEGAPYTGLKPAGYEPPEAIAAADRALENRAGSQLIHHVADSAAEALRERYERVMELRDHDPRDVDAGRRYVHAYVDYIHFLEKLHGLVSSEAGAHAHAPPAGAPAAIERSQRGGPNRLRPSRGSGIRISQDRRRALREPAGLRQPRREVVAWPGLRFWQGREAPCRQRRIHARTHSPGGSCRDGWR